MKSAPEPARGHLFQSERIAHFKESVIREMTRLAFRHNAVNLAQGFPDFAAPEEIKAAGRRAIEEDANQYSITWGSKPFRDAIAGYYRKHYQLEVDPERELTVCCGSTEGMIATLLACLNPGDEVVVFEPFYENYWPDSQLSGAVVRYVPLHAPDWTFDGTELRAAFNESTRAIIVNTPNNPSGRVFSRDELAQIGSLCEEFDALFITDEIYEHITFDGAQHIPPVTLPGLRERCVVVNSLSKTFSVTGWRVGWVIAPPDITPSIRKVHDFLTVGAATPLQLAGVTALAMPNAYYGELARRYQTKRDMLMRTLRECGFRPYEPRGAYYIMCDASGLGFKDDVALSLFLVQQIGVAAVPGSSFFSHSGGDQLIRFCFAKKEETLAAAAERLAKLPQLV